MKSFIKPTRALIALASVAALATPAMALNVQAPDLDPGPGLELPGDIAPHQNGGGGGGGGGSAGAQLGGNGNAIGRAAADPCPGGELQVSFDMDADGHPIPTSFERECVFLP